MGPKPGRRPPVQWLALKQLYKTGREAGRSLQFAHFADQREAQAVVPATSYDLAGLWDGAAEGRDYVVDYVADTGDGYDGTFAVAAGVSGLDGRAPADLLVLGGDEVYPVASIPDYHDRLERPFRDAFAAAQPDVRAQVERSLLVALPGNHDWYDGLVAFRRLFCESWVKAPADAGPDGRLVAPEHAQDRALKRRVVQERSYFAARLPYGWWVWAVDSQLDASTDASQLAYFEQARTKIRPGERVVLCIARPSWIDAPDWRDAYWISNKTIMTWFVDRMFGDTSAGGSCRDRVPLVLTGDKHHFARYTQTADAQDAGPEHLITCGGGGAFLASTHHLDPRLEVDWSPSRKVGPTAYELKNAFPDRATSEGLRSGWWRIPLQNGWGLPTLLVTLQVLLGLQVWRNVVHGGLTRTIVSVLCSLVLVGVFTALTVLLSKFKPRVKSVPVGLAHGLFRVVLSVLWALVWVATSSFGLGARMVALLFATEVLALVAVWSFALFLRLADEVGLHDNELFSAMAIEDFKSHLRLQISPPEAPNASGRLTVTAYGIDRVERNLRADTRIPSAARVLEVVTIPAGGAAVPSD